MVTVVEMAEAMAVEAVLEVAVAARVNVLTVVAMAAATAVMAVMAVASAAAMAAVLRVTTIAMVNSNLLAHKAHVLLRAKAVVVDLEWASNSLQVLRTSRALPAYLPVSQILCALAWI